LLVDDFVVVGFSEARIVRDVGDAEFGKLLTDLLAVRTALELVQFEHRDERTIATLIKDRPHSSPSFRACRRLRFGVATGLRIRRHVFAGTL
jgi:hypothetical protein